MSRGTNRAGEESRQTELLSNINNFKERRSSPRLSSTQSSKGLFKTPIQMVRTKEEVAHYKTQSSDNSSRRSIYLINEQSSRPDSDAVEPHHDSRRGSGRSPLSHLTSCSPHRRVSYNQNSIKMNHQCRGSPRVSGSKDNHVSVSLAPPISTPAAPIITPPLPNMNEYKENESSPRLSECKTPSRICRERKGMDETEPREHSLSLCGSKIAAAESPFEPAESSDRTTVAKASFRGERSNPDPPQNDEDKEERKKQREQKEAEEERHKQREKAYSDVLEVNEKLTAKVKSQNYIVQQLTKALDAKSATVDMERYLLHSTGDGAVGAASIRPETDAVNASLEADLFEERKQTRQLRDDLRQLQASHSETIAENEKRHADEIERLKTNMQTAFQHGTEQVLAFSHRSAAEAAAAESEKMTQEKKKLTARIAQLEVQKREADGRVKNEEKKHQRSIEEMKAMMLELRKLRRNDEAQQARIEQMQNELANTLERIDSYQQQVRFFEGEIEGLQLAHAAAMSSGPTVTDNGRNLEDTADSLRTNDHGLLRSSSEDHRSNSGAPSGQPIGSSRDVSRRNESLRSSSSSYFSNSSDGGYRSSRMPMNSVGGNVAEENKAMATKLKWMTSRNNTLTREVESFKSRLIDERLKTKSLEKNVSDLLAKIAEGEARSKVHQQEMEECTMRLKHEKQKSKDAAATASEMADKLARAEKNYNERERSWMQVTRSVGRQCERDWKLQQALLDIARERDRNNSAHVDATSTLSMMHNTDVGNSHGDRGGGTVGASLLSSMLTRDRTGHSLSGSNYDIAPDNSNDSKSNTTANNDPSLDEGAKESTGGLVTAETMTNEELLLCTTSSGRQYDDRAVTELA